MQPALKKVIEAAKKCLQTHGSPMQQSVLVQKIADMGEIPYGTANAHVYTLGNQAPEIFKKEKEKGDAFISLVEDNSPAQMNKSAAGNFSNRKEEDFYFSFAQYLEYGDEKGDKNRLDECTKAVAWGGSKSGEKWGTPDVVGVFKPKRNANVQFPHEIITAEVKIDTGKNALITAFGQSCAYRLFSHKTYLAVPKQGKSVRLKSLCHIFGIGLIYFDKDAEKITPDIYQMELLAQKHSPDMFYVNKFIEGELADKLYGQ